MPNSPNRFGLRRYIPTYVARAVRQRCGFGCIVCGSAIYDYEHFDPEFKDAREHKPEGIILLCPTHHRAKGGLISRATLERWSKAPYCKSSGFSHTPMDIDNLIVNLGPVITDRSLTALQVKSHFFLTRIGVANRVMGWIPVYAPAVLTRAIWFEPPEEAGAPLRLNLIANGVNGNRLAWIDNNVWHGSTENLDITAISGKERSKVEVVRKDGRVIIDLEFFPPNKINIYKYSSQFSDKSVDISGNCDEGLISIDGRPHISGSNMHIGCGVALSL